MLISSRINYHDVVTEVKELFKGHNDLITGFNIFAPSGYQIPNSQEEEQLPRILDECEMTIPLEEIKPLNAQSPQMMLGGEHITTPSRNEPFGGPEHANEFVKKVKVIFYKQMRYTLVRVYTFSLILKLVWLHFPSHPLEVHLRDLS